MLLTEAYSGKGVMLALWPSQALLQQIRSHATPPEDFHLTLVYLGESDALGVTGLRKVQAIFAKWCAECPPMEYKLAGLGRFSASPTSDGKDVIWASVDAPALPNLRQRLCAALDAAEISIPSDHGYTPHMTLDYIPVDAPMPLQRLPMMESRFDEGRMCVGGNHQIYPLTMS